MKRSLLSILIVCCSVWSYGQSFEGVLTYQVEFEFERQKVGGPEITKADLIQKMKKEGAYYDTLTIALKKGNYIKEDNSSLNKYIAYKAGANEIYIWEKDAEHILIADANKPQINNLFVFKPPSIVKTDSTKVINGHTCEMVKVVWNDLGEDYYFYNTDVAKLDAELFSKHHADYFSEIVKITNAYPIEVVKNIGNAMSIKMTLVDISEQAVQDTAFDLPAYKKANKKFTKMMLDLTGSKAMKIIY